MTLRRILIAVAIALPCLASPRTALSQTNAGPSGTITVTVTNSPVWDVEGIFTNVSFSVFHTNSAGDVSLTEVSFPVTVKQGGGGKISGSLQGIPVQVYAPYDTQETNYSFTGHDFVFGSIASGSNHVNFIISSTAAGSTFIRDANRAVSGNQTLVGKIDNLTRTLSINEHVSTSATGLPTRSNKNVFPSGPVDSTFLFAGDGSWTLSMTVVTVRRTVAGAATVTLNSGQTFTYTVLGVFRSAENESVLTLSGGPGNRASTLTVKLLGDTVTSISGKISGQRVAL